MNIQAPGTLATSLAGSDLNVDGQINIQGATRFQARIDVRAGGVIDLATATSQLNLEGGSATDPNRLEGGFIDGLGTLGAFGTALAGHGQINTDISFHGGSDLIAEGGTLVLNGAVLSADLIGAATGGTLQMSVPLNTSTVTALELNGGTVTGATVNNHGLTRGFGNVFTSQFVNNQRLVASGGTLVLNTQLAPDLDGTTEVGSLEATAGNLSIVDAPSDAVDGRVFIDQDREINFQAGWTQGAAGQLFLGNGTNGTATLRANNSLLGGSVMVDGATAIYGTVTFKNGSTTTFANGSSQMNLQSAAVIEPTATLAGPGTLINGGVSLTLPNGFSTDSRVRNGAALHLGAGSAVGSATLGVFQQDAGGVLNINVAGSNPGQYDTYLVDGDIAVDGTLQLIAPGYVPQFGDFFPILQSQSGSVSGEFSTLILPTLSDVRQQWLVNYADLSLGQEIVSLHVISNGDFNADLVYNSQDVDTLVFEIASATNDPQFDMTGDGFVTLADLDRWLAVAGAANLPSGNAYLPGDATLDGIVDGQDFIAWNVFKFGSTGLWSAGDFNADGLTDGQDFIIWNTFKFQSADAGNVAVPEPASLALLGSITLLGTMGLRRR